MENCVFYIDQVVPDDRDEKGSQCDKELFWEPSSQKFGRIGLLAVSIQEGLLVYKEWTDDFILQ